MNTNSPFDDRDHRLNSQDFSDETGQHTNESTGAMDMVKRDRFELLSAYLDGEVTASESREVEEWLKNDASVQLLYSRLLNLRQGLRNIPVPAPSQSPQVTSQQVLQRLRRRSLPIWAFGGAAIAACMIGAVSGFIPGGGFKTLQLAQKPLEPTAGKAQPVVSNSPLMVALNNPVIEIPKAAIASPENSVNLDLPILGEIEPNIN
ncbi:transcriptional regulator [Nodularia harveyana UHCC-0300]|uniref:Transcriptional regulator n=1 Tax=Nodularia harveyana UHCC-0300 TaxID=2974287 RepID=A0ABU5UHP4_9CYAN|nr:transcriptional regulator [Nodularia harveyana]MEA5583087.1 transcriptional regulator [Nodularia harveyana UHCC-0300]